MIITSTMMVGLLSRLLHHPRPPRSLLLQHLIRLKGHCFVEVALFVEITYHRSSYCRNKIPVLGRNEEKQLECYRYYKKIEVERNNHAHS